MKRNFTHEDFEDFLKGNADDLRMPPSQKVWQNLSKELNKRKRRFILIGLSSFLLISSTVGYLALTNAEDNQKLISQQPEGSGKETKTPVAPQQTETTATTNTVNKPSSSTPSQTQVNARRETSNPLRIAYSSRRNHLSGTATDSQTTNTGVRDVNPNGTPTTGSSDGNSFTPTVVDSYTEFEHLENKTEKKDETQQPLTMVHSLPLSIESVVNSYKTKGGKAKLETQYYFVPTISYRRLSENKSYLRTLSPSSAATNSAAFHSSVNNEVTHKPDLGFELGMAVKYPVSKALKLRAGLQFNVNRYDIKAYSSYLAPTTIALNGSRVDSLNTYTRYSNIDGYKSDWLQNLSFQLSAPIGIELLLGGSEDEKLHFGVAGTFQPTYVLGDKAYLISTDYKNYALVPWLARRWNVNTAFETFITYKTEKIKWQVGPQVRYQLLSSFADKYPVKENLFDFGFKIAISSSK